MRCRTQLLSLIILGSALLIPFGTLESAASPDRDIKQVSLAQYKLDLERIYAQLQKLPEHPDDADSLHDSIPDEYQVGTPSFTFHIDNGDLKYSLDRYISDREERAEILPEIELKVQTQIEGAKDYKRPTDSSARAKLDSILAGREYRNVSKTQSPLERLKDFAVGWLIRILRSVFRAAVAHPRVSRILLWTVIGVVTLSLIWWLYSLLRRTTRDEYSFPSGEGALTPSHKRWQQWLAEARAAAERCDWREAVHLAYWSAISYLESSGAWKPDRARTPREYLRILPDVSERREPLTELTRRFESTWYAQHPASLTDFEFSLSQLEKIGCR